MPQTKLVFRTPSGKRIQTDLSSERETFDFNSKVDTEGQWFLYQPESDVRLIGIHNASRMDHVRDALVFNSSLEDTGEDFVILLYSGGYKTVRISLSPKKCGTTELYSYLSEYTRLINHPQPGAKTVSGESGPSGRPPTPDELVFRVIEECVSLLQSSGKLRYDLSKHDRGSSGRSGVDAVRTLEAWKRHPHWYRVATQDDRSAINVGGTGVVPLRTVPRETKSAGGNKFIGSLNTAIKDLTGRVPRTAVGGSVIYLLKQALKRSQSLDKPANVGIREAWRHLTDQEHPDRSQIVASQARVLKEDLISKKPHRYALNGYVPYFMHPPDLIFQWFGVAASLIALGLDRYEVRGIAKPGSERNYEFGDYRAWIDTDRHGLTGWRDQTGSPSRYKPDLVVRDTQTGGKLLVDAKFRRSDKDDRLMSSSSIKDIQAYMQEYELRRSVILLPHSEGDQTTEDVRSGDMWI